MNRTSILINTFVDDRGFSLLEIIVVIIIMSVLSLVALQSFGNQAEKERFEATIAEMEQLKYAVSGNPDAIVDGIRTDFGYVGDVGDVPTVITQLVADPLLGNWNGPYMRIDFQEDPDDYRYDAYGIAYDYDDNNLTFYSPGADATIQVGNTYAELTSNTVRVFITDRDGYTPQASDLGNISVVLTLQSGGTINGTVQAGGICTLTGVHIGNHVLTVTHSVLSETVPKRVSVNPGMTPSPLEIIFSSLP